MLLEMKPIEIRWRRRPKTGCGKKGNAVQGGPARKKGKPINTGQKEDFCELETHKKGKRTRGRGGRGEEKIKS